MTALDNDLEIHKVATHLQNLGNTKFKEKSFELAHSQYKDALSQAENVKYITPKVDELKVVILQNMSKCTNATNDF